jgi:hypothetical protein
MAENDNGFFGIHLALKVLVVVDNAAATSRKLSTRDIANEIHQMRPELHYGNLKSRVYRIISGAIKDQIFLDELHKDPKYNFDKRLITGINGRNE